MLNIEKIEMFNILYYIVSLVVKERAISENADILKRKLIQLLFLLCRTSFNILPFQMCSEYFTFFQ